MDKQSSLLNKELALCIGKVGTNLASKDETIDQLSDHTAITARLEAELSEIEAAAEHYLNQEQQLRNKKQV